MSVLDLLADDYAKVCRDMTQGEFEAAALKTLEGSKFFPTVAHIREAHEAAKADRRRDEIQAYAENTEHYDGPITNRGREVLEALKNGRKPDFLN